MTALQKLKSAVESQNCMAIGDLQAAFGPVTEVKTEAQRRKGTCQGLLSHLVEKSVLGLRFPDSFRNLQWIMLQDAKAGCALTQHTVQPWVTCTL